MVLLEDLRWSVRWWHLHCPGACACTSFMYVIYCCEQSRPSQFANNTNTVQPNLQIILSNPPAPPGACMCGVNVSTTWHCLWPLHPRQLLPAVMISPNHLLDPTTPSSLPGACVPATVGTHANVLGRNTIIWYNLIIYTWRNSCFFLFGKHGRFGDTIYLFNVTRSPTK